MTIEDIARISHNVAAFAASKMGVFSTRWDQLAPETQGAVIDATKAAMHGDVADSQTVADRLAFELKEFLD
jgi:hypothetical protein